MISLALRALLTPFSAVPPVRAILWSGAGLSVAPPTRLPLGAELTERLIDYGCRSGTWARMLRYFSAGGLESGDGLRKEVPRLEIIAEALYRVLGPKALTPLWPCANAIPNPGHFVVARHIAAGGEHITCNFDTCIEACLPPAAKKKVLHLHGCADGANWEKLGTRLTRVAGGLPPDIGDALTAKLRSADLLVVVGYSGSDYFDVVPHIWSLGSTGIRLDRLRVLWWQHAAISPRRLALRRAVPGFSILSALAECGAAVTYARGPTDQLLEGLAEVWSLPSIPRLPDRAPSNSEGWSVTDEERTVATAELWSCMGIATEATLLDSDLRLVGSRSPTERLRSRAYLNLDDAWRNAGAYVRAAKSARRIAGRTAASQVVSLHRLGGDFWLRGDAGRAIALLALATGSAGRCRLDGTGFTQEDLDDVPITLLHALRDVGRNAPALEWITRPWALAVLHRRLRDIDRYRDNPHALAKLRRLTLELESSSGLPDPTIKRMANFDEETFHETDSFLGAGNILRRQLVWRWEHGQPVGRAAIERLLALSLLIGDYPGTAKAGLLARATGVSIEVPIDDVLPRIEWNGRLRRRWQRCWQERRAWR